MRPGFDLEGKRVLVVGLARTGLACALFSAAYGAHVTATDDRAETELGETATRLREAGVKLEAAGCGRKFSRTGFDCGEPGSTGEYSSACCGAKKGNCDLERD